MVLVLDGRQIRDSTFEASFSVAAHIVKLRAVAGESFPQRDHWATGGQSV